MGSRAVGAMATARVAMAGSTRLGDIVSRPRMGAWLADAVIVGENRWPSSQESSPGSELAGISRSSRKTRVAALGLRAEVPSISLI